MMPRKNEKRLVEKAQKNPKYFGELYEIYYTRIRVYVLKMVSNEAVADDVTGMVFEKALDKISYFQWQGVSFGSWLYRIARNCVYDYYRSARRRKTIKLPDEQELKQDNEESLEESVLHSESELQLYAVIAELKKDDQYLIYYRYFEGMSVREVAGRTDMSEANVATRLHRIRGRLKEFLSHAANL